MGRNHEGEMVIDSSQNYGCYGCTQKEDNVSDFCWDCPNWEARQKAVWEELGTLKKGQEQQAKS